MRIETKRIGLTVLSLDGTELKALAALISRSYSDVVDENVCRLDVQTLRAAERLSRAVTAEASLQRIRDRSRGGRQNGVAPG